ncbi:MAG: hypothetical protein ACTSRW_06755 [Candidatus Helarchaeota archaeon]
MFDLQPPQEQRVNIGIVDKKLVFEMNEEYCSELEKIDSLDSYQLQVLLLLVLEGLAKRSISSLSFQGIKRKLNIHQQILTKALNRLLDKEFISKRSDDNHYVLSDKGRNFLQRLLLQIKSRKTSSTNKWRIIEQTHKTPLTAREFLENLMGKWFGNFRWVGWFQDRDSIKVEWISTDNAYEAIASHEGRNQVQQGNIVKTFLVQKSPEKSLKELEIQSKQFNIQISKLLSQAPQIPSKQDVVTSATKFTTSNLQNWLNQFPAN